MNSPGLAELRALAVIAARGSFRQAADELGVSPSTLSHMIRELEQKLGVRLLHRTTRSVSATEAGAKFLGRLGPVLRELDAALEDIDGLRGAARGTLRINSSEIAGAVLLRHVIPTFLAQHQGMAVDLVTDGRLVDIVAGGFDAGVRLAEAVPQDMIAVRFGGDARFIAVASPKYLAGRVLTTPDDLKRHVCIRFRLPSGKPYRWEFSRQGQEVAVEVAGPLILDHAALMTAAALGDLGIAYVAERTAREHIARGALVSVLDAWCPAIPGLCLYYPGHRHVPQGLRAFIDVLRAVEF